MTSDSKRQRSAQPKRYGEQDLLGCVGTIPDEPSRESATQKRSRENLEVIWEQLAEAYGRRFTSQYGVEPAQAWIRACQAFSDIELARGLANWCEEDMRKPKDKQGWPPTLSEFIAAVKQKARACRSHAPFPVLPRPKGTKAGWKRWREQMVEMGKLKALPDEHEQESIG